MKHVKLSKKQRMERDRFIAALSEPLEQPDYDMAA